ncbi:MAG: hypothetical protein CMK09_18530 [Ponticaulis sp.]|nr:hypothetical protein [Ponticaulis sp.]|tara:strand:+ start:80488 stop:80928 length:441 start_codon:yes stop_codon:yes gene_type:complete
MLKSKCVLALSLFALAAPLAHAAENSADKDVKSYTCRSEGGEILVSEEAGAVKAFVLSSCSRVGCMTLGLDDPDNGKLNISTSYLDGSTIDIATTARLSENGILVNSPIVVGQFGSDLTRLIGFANRFLEEYTVGDRDALNCELQD